ncbi:MAG: TlpA family protein disulfide reductase [Acidobacteria bacterium]|jgi:thiol-disulfide isomerase/thioredoxin|nr:MAG: TlpA family protein disulfide reductase [Acidobacteriota bacterium]GIU81299.1 MAG: thiol-disulfide oxidoreductase YkuV [Pyrinomonadaceae bacterium]
MMRIGDKIPSFNGATQWLNTSEDFRIEDHLQGSPTLVYFWAVSCGICKENLPKLKELKEKYEKQGLKFVAVHMPRYEADTDIEKVLQIIKEFSIDDVCAIDNLHKLREAFRNEQGWVPVYYLFDAEGKLKTRAAGEYGIGIITSTLEKMFPEAKQASA